MRRQGETGLPGGEGELVQREVEGPAGGPRAMTGTRLDTQQGQAPSVRGGRGTGGVLEGGAHRAQGVDDAVPSETVSRTAG